MVTSAPPKPRGGGWWIILACALVGGGLALALAFDPNAVQVYVRYVGMAPATHDPRDLGDISRALVTIFVPIGLVLGALVGLGVSFSTRRSTILPWMGICLVLGIVTHCLMLEIDMARGYVRMERWDAYGYHLWPAVMCAVAGGLGGFLGAFLRGAVGGALAGVILGFLSGRVLVQFTGPSALMKGDPIYFLLIVGTPVIGGILGAVLLDRARSRRKRAAVPGNK